jgi:hypothetical protein
MRNGSRTLADYPQTMVHLACSRCTRKGQYRKTTLIEEYGGNITLPDLRHLIGKCERDGKLGDACGIYYVDLVPKK